MMDTLLAPPLRRFPAEVTAEPLLEALAADGTAIVEGVLDTATVAAVRAEFRPHLDAEGLDSAGDFNGYKTLRIGAILAKSTAVIPLLLHPLVLAMADRFLLPHCVNYRFGSLTGIEILPGETPQRLHRDQNCYSHRFAGVEFEVAVMWALDDFTLQNGATRVIPGSHRWTLDRLPTAEDATAQAVMPTGSMLLYLGTSYHGGGANLSERPRMGLVNTYSLGWLRQEENMALSVPRETAERLPPAIRALMGYRPHGLVGWYPGASGGP